MLWGMKHRHSRRVFRSPKEIQTLLRAFDREGLSARQFALQHQIAPASLANWLRRRRAGKSVVKPRWVEVVRSSPPASPGPVVTIEGLQGLKIHLAAGFVPGPVVELMELLREL